MKPGERTPQSLLGRLRCSRSPEAWAQFVRIYSPLMFYWARHAGLQESDAADLVQDVFLVLLQQLPTFAYDPGRSFRGWLHTILLNKLRERMRRPALTIGSESLARIEDPKPSAFLDDPSERQQFLQRALTCLSGEFQPSTWEAFRQTVLLGVPAETVAAELSLSLNAVYIARSRVLRRLREELEGLLP